ncbi:MAG: putative rane associated hydrolase, partial [Bacteroidetes bacterium]|nr:putative rane associated hydrolase [Bacteroidota bacterium]
NVRAERFSRLDDGKLETMVISPEFEINTKKGIHGEISLEYQEEGVMFDFPLSDSIRIHAGNYSFTGVETRFGTPDTRMISLRADLNAGQFYDGMRYGFRAEPNFNLSSSLKLSATYEFNAIRFAERPVNNSLNIHSVNLKALYMLNTKLSASVLLQYVNTEDELITNFRIRYNPREGNDFYLVFNDLRGITDRLSIPERPKFFNKTVMVKYTHTFIL